jgi:3-hydroxyacyl-CoA dehydrogenase
MSVRPFKKVCVIGAGVMGSGIASHLANARIPVLLLDIVPPKHGEGDPPADSRAFRDKFANGGLAKALKSKPASFMSKQDAAFVETGNLDDDLARINECDWVIEVVLERLDVKQQLFEKIDNVLERDDTIVTSNTSGLKIEDMLEGRSEGFKKNFFVTHFFNPVRYLHLLEIVKGEATDDANVARVAAFGEEVLGKGIVYGKDTPNFVANRIGVFGMMETMRVMVEDGYTLEEVDATFGEPAGRAKSAVFRTADVVGLDTFIHVAENCWENLKDDERHEVFETPAFLKKMVDNGWSGQKSGQGFYKKEGKEILALDLDKMEYRPKEKVRIDSLGAIRGMDKLEERLEHLAYADDKAGNLFWKVTAATAIYAANRLGEIADDIVQIDNGMKWGFANDMGPFEVWDAIGVKKSVERMVKEGMKVPAWVGDMLEGGRESFYAFDGDGSRTYWDPDAKKAVVLDEGSQVQTFAMLKRDEKRVVKDWFGASLVDLGDGVLACEFHSKMNAIDSDIMEALNEGMDLCDAGKFDALVLANDDKKAFSVGANILMVGMAAQQEEWGQIEEMVKALQDTVMRLRYSSFPTVAAPFQLALGGGNELQMWCNHTRAHAETYIGLVEVGVGVLPAGGGTTEMTFRTLENAVDDPTFPVEQMLRRGLETIAMAKVATSAEEGKELLHLRKSDAVTMNRRHLLEAAKQDALGMVRAGFRAPRPRKVRLPGRGALATIEMALAPMRDGHFISDHDLLIAMKVANVMTGGDTSPRVYTDEQRLLDLEREAFLSLVGEEKTQARIMHMLQSGKPLRN